MDLQRFKQKPVMGIVRGIGRDVLTPLLDTVTSAGLETLEITMNTANAPQLIAEAVRYSGGKLMIGAGTVLSMDELQSALDAGASYIVMPMLVPDVMRFCVENHIPVFPGALTPQEIVHAWNAGATMVKVFPAKFFGPTYFKEMKGPFNSIPLLACGGITPESLPEYQKNGADAFAFGGSIFSLKHLQEKKYDVIAGNVRKLLAAYQPAPVI